MFCNRSKGYGQINQERESKPNGGKDKGSATGQACERVSKPTGGMKGPAAGQACERVNKPTGGIMFCSRSTGYGQINQER